MNRLAIAGLASVVLAACSTPFPPHAGIAPDSTRPQIHVTADNRLVVNQEPIIVPRGAGEFRVTWQLPRDGRARFMRENGMTIDALDKLLQPDGNPAKATPDDVAKANRTLKARAASSVSLFPCSYQSDFEFSCTVSTRDLPHGLYAYTIRVTIDGKPFILDPRMMY